MSRRLLLVGLVACSSAPAVTPAPKPPAAATVDLAHEALPAGAALRFGTIRLRMDEVARALAFTPDQSKLVGISLDYFFVWDARTGERLHRVPIDGVTGLAVAPDGLRAVTSGYGGVRVWDLASGATERELPYPDSHAVAFAPDGKRLAIGAAGALTIVETAGWTVEQRVPFFDDMGAAAPSVFRFTDDGGLFAVVPRPGRGAPVEVLDVLGGGRVTLDAVPRDAGPAMFSADGSWIVIGDHSDLLVYAVDTGALRARLTMPPFRQPDDFFEAVAISPDGSQLAAAHLGVAVVPVAGGDPRVIDDRGSFAIAWSPDGATIACDGLSRSVRLRRVSDGSRVDALPGHEGELLEVDVSPDGMRVATASWDHTVRIWDAATGAQLHTLTSEETPYAIEFLPDGERLVVGYSEPVMRVFDVATAAQLDEERVGERGYFINLEVQAGILAVALDNQVEFRDATTLAPAQGDGYFGGFSMHGGSLSPDGETITGEYGGHVSVFDRKSGLRHDAPEGRWPYAWSPDGALTAVGLGGATSIERRDGSVALTLDGEGGATWSPDGALLATAADAAVIVRDTATWTTLHRLTGHEGTITGLAWSPDGATLYTASRDTTALAWRVR